MLSHRLDPVHVVPVLLEGLDGVVRLLDGVGGQAGHQHGRVGLTVLETLDGLGNVSTIGEFPGLQLLFKLSTKDGDA